MNITLTTTDVVIACLVALQLITCGLALYVYRSLTREAQDTAERIDFVLDALDSLRQYLQGYNDRTIVDDDQEAEETVDLDDPDWWKKS